MNQDLIALHDGLVLFVHGRDVCDGPPCCVHAPSDHPLRDAPLAWRRVDDGVGVGSLGFMLRVCDHGELHPDPDDRLLRSLGVTRRHRVGNDCDRCCGPRVPDPNDVTPL